MSTSASIYQMIRPAEAPNVLSQALQAENLMQARRSGRMNEMQLDEYQRGIQTKNKLQEILGGQYADDSARESALIRGGFIDQAGTLQKNRAEDAKSQSALTKDKAEIFSKYLSASKDIASRVMANPTPESATQALDFMENIGKQLGLDVSKDLQAQRQGLTQFTSPDQIKRWAAGHALNAEKLLPQFQRSDIGGQVQNLAIDPLTAQATTTGTTQKTQSPDSAASVAATIRGQNMVDARMRESANAAKDNKVAPKPLPASALKMQQEAVDAIGVVGGINADLSALENQIGKGELSFGPVSNLLNTGRNMAGMSSAQSRNFATFKSNMERLRNESLRLNTGVQTDGDAQRAWNELFQNITDTDLVKQRLQEIQRINKRGAELQKLKVDNVRANYGYEPLDVSPQMNQQPALLGGNAPVRKYNPATGRIE